MKLVLPQLHIEENEGFTPEKDIFNRKHLGESLLNIVKKSDSEMVIAINANWGEGKSIFAKMWRGHLTSW